VQSELTASVETGSERALLVAALRFSDGRIRAFEVRRTEDPPGQRPLEATLDGVPGAKFNRSNRTWTLPGRSARYLRAALSSDVGAYLCVAQDADTARKLGLPFPDPDVPTPVVWPITAGALRIAALLRVRGGGRLERSEGKASVVVRVQGTRHRLPHQVFQDATRANLIEHGPRGRLVVTAFGIKMLDDPRARHRLARTAFRPHRYLRSHDELLRERQLERDRTRERRWRREPGPLEWDAERVEHTLNGDRVASGDTLELWRGDPDVGARWVRGRYELADHSSGQANLVGRGQTHEVRPDALLRRVDDAKA
jgi:hypothetical protein